MNSFKLFTMVILTVVAISVGRAPAKVTVQLHIPPEGQWQMENLWYVELNNQTETTYTCYLHGEIWEATKGLVFKANSREFQLPPGRQIRKGRKDVDPLRDVWYAKGYEEFAVRTGGLPEGKYTFIALLERNLGGDTIEFEVRPFSPPRLVSPRDGDTVRTQYPQFVWTPPARLPKGRVTYELKMVEVLTGQTPEEALRANPPWFERSGLLSTRLTYPTSAPTLGGHRYVWLVRAVLGGRVSESEVRSFYLYKPETPVERLFVSPAYVRAVQREIDLLNELADRRSGTDYIRSASRSLSKMLAILKESHGPASAVLANGLAECGKAIDSIAAVADVDDKWRENLEVPEVICDDDLWTSYCRLRVLKEISTLASDEGMDAWVLLQSACPDIGTNLSNLAYSHWGSIKSLGLDIQRIVVLLRILPEVQRSYLRSVQQDTTQFSVMGWSNRWDAAEWYLMQRLQKRQTGISDWQVLKGVLSPSRLEEVLKVLNYEK